MRQKFFWFDLAVCSIWMLMAQESGSSWYYLSHFLVAVAVVMRVILSFSLYRGEKRSWIPLAVFSVLFVFLFAYGHMKYTIGGCVDLPFIVLGLQRDDSTSDILRYVLTAWLFLGPLVVYIVELCRKKLTASAWTWKDALGAMLWKDKGARTYCQLMLITLCATFAGLAMDIRMCRFACIVLPPLSLYLIARHVSAGRDSSEARPMVRNIGLMVVAMVPFFLAQHFAGIWRVSMLVVSIVIVAYACWQALGRQGLAGISLLASVYLGILLPTLAIGHNQYVCLDYGSKGNYPLEPFRGILLIEDAKTGKVGLRDRYGLLLKPAYENIVHHSGTDAWSIFELRNNGNYTLYNICSNKMLKSNVGNQQLQDFICQQLNAYCNRNEYGYMEKLEVRVTAKDNAELPLAHVKMSKNGMVQPDYDYSDRPFILPDTLSLCSGEFATDTTSCYGDTMYTLHYSFDVKRDSTTLYNIDVKTMQRSMPQKEGLVELAKGIEALLKK